MVGFKTYIKNFLMASLMLIAFVLMYYISIQNYLLFHTFVELAGVAVSITIFSIGWNSRQYSGNNFMTVLAVGYLIVGILTIFHTLVYKGMGIFAEQGMNMSAQFWIATHYVVSITILLAGFCLRREKPVNSKLLLGMFLFICSLIIASIFTGNFPDCFVEEKGLTSFKIFSEYLICIILVFSGYYLIKNNYNKFQAYIFNFILGSIVFIILSELCFTLYTDPYGFLNLLGHFFMIISIILSYISLVKYNLIRPYNSVFKNIANYAEELTGKNNEEDIICGSTSFLDITEWKKIEEELIRLKNDAVAANIAKSNFLANMSHEIRTPMNGIVGFLQLLENTTTSNEQLEYINNIKTSTDTLLSLINDILDISKIEAGKMEFEKIPFDLHSAIAKSIIPFTAKAEECGLDIHMLISPDVPQFVIGDPTRLRQVISNLIGNAIKYTQKGYVLLEVKLNNIKEYLVMLQITVEDTGIGISQEDIKKIFNPFTQASDSASRMFGGTGLGLAISKSIVMMMGGNVEVESIEGKGSKFIFNILLELDMNAKSINIENDYLALKNKKIMIVDDNHINRNIAKIYLEEAGCMVTEADNVPDALNILVREEDVTYNVMLVNYSMQIMNDYDLVAVLKTIQSTKGIRIILLTPIKYNIEARALCSKDVFGYISKPYKQNELLNGIAKAINGKKEKCSDEGTLITLNKEKETNQDRLKVLLIEDNEISKDFFVKLLNLQGINCDIAINGEEAIKYYLNKNYDLLFMDCQMPVMDGYEATRRIRELEGDKRHIPIIALTANAMKGDLEKCLSSGMDDYLSKPVDIKQVTAILKKYTNKIISKETISYYKYSVFWLMNEVGFDKNSAEALLEKGVNNILNLINEAQNHINNKRINDISAILHQIKGLAGNLRIIEIVDMAVQAEPALKAGSDKTLQNILLEMKCILNENNK